MKRLRVVVLYGGRSVEREVSRVSARTIVSSLDPGRYEVVPMAVGQDGRFLSPAASAKLLADPGRLSFGVARPWPLKLFQLDE